MKAFCVALGLAVIVVAPSAAMAQSEGAIVTRGQDAYFIGMVEYDGDQTLIVFSNYPDFSCQGEDPVPFRWQTVMTPVGAQHYHDNAMTFTRVYRATYAELDADPYEFICGGAHFPWAEGTVSMMFFDNQADPAAPGANVWGHVMNGTLTDLEGNCKSGLVKLDVVHMLRLAPSADYPACLPSCLVYRTFKGPTATCVGKK